MIKPFILIISIVILIAGLICAFLYLRKTEGIAAFDKLMICLYYPLAVWSSVYFVVCIIYAGFTLSLIWIWPALAIFCFVRIKMIRSAAEGRRRHAPKWAKIAYRTVVAILLIFFLFIESRVVDAMTATPPADLDYVIVLGAGLNGTEPTNPLRVRIKRGAEYLEENPGTVLIASGGQGRDEVISEAQCIGDQLVSVYGIEESRIILEDASRDTEENLANSLKIIGDPKTSVGIISNGFHEYRALMIADAVGYENVCPVPATTLLPVGIHYIVREFFGVVECMIKYR